MEKCSVSVWHCCWTCSQSYLVVWPLLLLYVGHQGVHQALRVSHLLSCSFIDRTQVPINTHTHTHSGCIGPRKCSVGVAPRGT